MAIAMGTNELIIHNVEGGGFHRGLQALILTLPLMVHDGAASWNINGIYMTTESETGMKTYF